MGAGSAWLRGVEAVRRHHGYLVAVGAVALALLLRSSLQPWVGGPSFVFFFGAVILSAWYGGRGPGALSVLLGSLVNAYYFLPPSASLLIDAQEFFHVAMFAGEAALLTWFIAGRAHLQRALAAANARLHGIDRERRIAVSAATHELRNPLTPMMLDVGMLRARGPLDPGSARAVDSLERNLERMRRLTQDLLDTSRLQSGKLRLHPGAVDLAELAARCVQALGPAAREAGVALALDAPGPAPLVGDEARLTQVLENLVGNAVRFTPRGGAVEVRVRGLPGAVQLEVADTGLGFTGEQRARLFEPFAQAHAGQVAGGTGLGLYIARGIVEAHGGRVAAASGGPGRGSVFRVRLPLRPPRASPAEAAGYDRAPGELTAPSG